MDDHHHLDRRALLTGVGAAGALGATHALAQIPSLGGLIPGGAPAGVGKALDYATQAANVMASIKISEPEEIAMGNTYYDNFIDQSGGYYNDRVAQDALRRFAEPLIATTSRTAFQWDVALLDNETVNAWALPGGKLAVHKGLIRYAATPEELAAVLSHEIGHAELSHGIAQIKDKKTVQGLGGVAKQAIVDRVGQSSAGSTGAFLTREVLSAFEGPIYDMITSGYSQNLEYAADGHIVGLFDKVGFDRTRATTFYGTMLRLVPPETKATTSLYATHPGTKDRIARLQKLVAADKLKPPESAGHPGWEELKLAFPTRTRFRLNT
jgi:predicted Zn-dependent protease